MPETLLGIDLVFMWGLVPDFLRALVVTIEISFLSIFFGLIAGLILGSLRVIGPRPVQVAIQWFVNYMRGTPHLLQIYIIYFILPRTGVFISEFWSGVIAISIVAAGYEVEIVRAAIESIEPGQREAAHAIGMDERMTLWLILLPQAVRRMIPPLTNELANVIKATALLSVIAVNEVTKVMNKTIFEHFVFWEAIIPAAVLYLMVFKVLEWVSDYLENRIFAFGGFAAIEEAR